MGYREPTRADDEQIDQIRALAGQGKTDTQIAQALSFHVSTVRRLRERNGIPSPHRAEKERRNAALKELHAAGLSDKEIALCLDMKLNTVQSLRQYHGLTANRPFIPVARPPRLTREAKRAAAKQYAATRKEPPKPKVNIRTKVAPLCAALGNVYAKEPGPEIQGAIQAAMRAVDGDRAFAKAWAEARRV